MVGFLQGYAAAYPGWARLESVGKSGQGRDLWMITLQNPATGNELAKPAMYIDGNTHANEVQGGEAALYSVGFLLGNYGKLERVTELLDRAVFYILPVVNPDGRALWFRGPSNPDFPRTVMVPVDDDRDGLVDEDGYEDLDGDGVITGMRKKVPMGQGSYRQDPKDPRRLAALQPGELGDWVLLGEEGIDNDGDGRVNEDQVGYVDPNRTWGYYWEPPYVQAGAGAYPLSIPETRAIATWALKHPNIAAVQSYHNNGRMILRGPGAKSDPPYPGVDLKVYDLIAQRGGEAAPRLPLPDQLEGPLHRPRRHDRPLLRHPRRHRLYQRAVRHAGRLRQKRQRQRGGAAALQRPADARPPVRRVEAGEAPAVRRGGGGRQPAGRRPRARGLAPRRGDAPQQRLRALPRLPPAAAQLGEASVRKLGGKLWRVEVPVLNDRAIPSMTARARQDKLHRQDVATVTGARVVSSGIVDDPWLDKVTIQEHRPERLMVPGVEGLSTRRLFFLVEGDGEVTVQYDSLKGGKLTKKVALK